LKKRCFHVRREKNGNDKKNSSIRNMQMPQRVNESQIIYDLLN